MRILHISSARTFGGGERHLSDLVEALVARGHEVYVAVSPTSPLRDAPTTLPAGNLITLPFCRNALDLGSGLRLAHIVREKRIEIVHAHLARDYSLAAFATWMARRRHKNDRAAQLVITRHVLFPLGRIHRFTLSRVARVIAVSASVARALEAQKLFLAHKIRVVPNGIKLARFDVNGHDFNRAQYRQKLSNRADFIVTTIGELSYVKGQEDFVRAAAVVAREFTGTVDFMIVGEEDSSNNGQIRARITSLINELGLFGRVHLLGRRDDIALLLSASDVFVSASRSEAFGLAIIEAMACGVPVVATQTEGAYEIITDGVTGKLVPIGNTEAMATMILNLLSNAEQRRGLGAQARDMVCARFSVDRMVEETETVYREALEANHACHKQA